MRTVFAGLLLALASGLGCVTESPQSTSAPSGTDVAQSAAPSGSAVAPVKKRSAELAPGTPTDYYYIDWGDVAAVLEVNGGPITTKGSFVDQMGLNLRLVDGNDVAKQVAAYKAGTTPFLRLTSQQALDVAPDLCATPDTCPVPVLLATWSVGGDHIVALDGIKTIADLKGGARIALQDYGPHGGLLVDVIETDAKLSLNDVKLVRTKNLSGPDSPVAVLQAGKADAAFVITPDRDLLTSGGSVGTGAEGSVTGAHEILSTAERTRSVADLVFVHPAYRASHPDDVVKFVVAMLKGQENVVELKKAYEANGSDAYRALLQDVSLLLGSVPDGSEADAAGLVADCAFVGHPGNVAFFTDAANSTGWAYFNKRGAEVAVKLGYSTKAVTLPESPVNWNLPIFKQHLTKTEAAKGQRFNVAAVRQDLEKMETDGSLADNTRLSFTVYFGRDETDIDAAALAPEFARIASLGQSYTRAAILIRGHADPTHMVANTIRAGIKVGEIQESGNAATGRVYVMGGKPIDLRNDRGILKLATNPRYNGMYPEGDNPRELSAASIDMTKTRADKVRQAFFDFAKKNGIVIDESQVQTDGVGYAEPLVVKAKDEAEAALNRRVEFALVSVSAETVTQSDFDL